MGLSESLIEAKSEIDSLITFGNQTTGNHDTRIGDVIRALAGGYGQGSGGSNVDFIPESDTSHVWGHMMTQLVTGNIKSGKKIWTEAFELTNETLFLNTGLSNIRGLIFYITDSDANTTVENALQNGRFTIIVKNDDDTLTAVCMSTTKASNAAQSFVSYTGYEQGTAMAGLPLNGSLRLDGGNVYVKGRYNKNANYQIVKVNTEYTWVAWGDELPTQDPDTFSFTYTLDEDFTSTSNTILVSDYRPDGYAEFANSLTPGDLILCTCETNATKSGALKKYRMLYLLQLNNQWAPGTASIEMTDNKLVNGISFSHLLRAQLNTRTSNSSTTILARINAANNYPTVFEAGVYTFTLKRIGS